MPDRAISVPQATQIAQATKRQLTELNGRLTTVDTLQNISALAAVKKRSVLTPCNVFNKDTATIGRFNASGEWIKDSTRTYSCSDFIPVSANDIVYKNTPNCYTAFYNSEKTLIGSVVSSERQSTAPEGSAYFRIAPANTFLNAFMVFINAPIPNVYYSYGDGPNVALNAVTQAELSETRAEIDSFHGEITYKTVGDAIAETNVYTDRYINASGNLYSAGTNRCEVHEVPVAEGDYLIVGTTKLAKNYPIVGFKQTSGTNGQVTIIATGSATDETYKIHYKSTENGYLFIAAFTPNPVLSVYNAVKTSEGLEALEAAKATVKNPWHGKKVVWLGTSVSFGQYATKSYAQEAAKYLGFNLVNCSVPGLAIEMNNGTIKQYGSLTASKAEYASAGITIADAPVTPYVPGGSYNNYYRTWENIFVEENADADLWVFDVAPNNSDFATTDWAAFNKSAWAYNDSSTFADHRNTFIGALLFLMDKMYELNPQARMIFFLGSSFAYSGGKQAFETLANEWNIGIINVWGKVNTSPKSLLQLKSQNGTNAHPSTFAHEVMGKMLVGEFNRFA